MDIYWATDRITLDVMQMGIPSLVQVACFHSTATKMCAVAL